MPLVERALAKINLGLHILRRRPDGDHDVETVLHRFDWADPITAQPAETTPSSSVDGRFAFQGKGHRNSAVSTRT